MDWSISSSSESPRATGVGRIAMGLTTLPPPAGGEPEADQSWPHCPKAMSSPALSSSSNESAVVSAAAAAAAALVCRRVCTTPTEDAAALVGLPVVTAASAALRVVARVVDRVVRGVDMPSTSADLCPLSLSLQSRVAWLACLP